MDKPKTRLLCIDDEPNLLDGLSRQLHGDFDVVTAVGGAEGLKVFNEQGPFPIVMSDLRMPEMDGVAFLSKVRQANPDTVRILLTGQADMESAIGAVNEGHIFRFLTKPCPSEVLLKALKAAEEQYHLIMAEKVLLEQTLQGSVKTLVDVLSLASPDIFSRVNRMKSHLVGLMEGIDAKEKWPIEVATMLSQIGAITLPDETAVKLSRGGVDLKPHEQEMVSKLPMIGVKLLSHIPRLEPVTEILKYQEKCFNGAGLPSDDRKGDKLPLGSRILKILLDYERLEAQGYDPAYIFDTMQGRIGWYEEVLLKKLIAVSGDFHKNSDMREIRVIGLQIGMILEEAMLTKTGTLVVRQGTEVTQALMLRIQHIAEQSGIKEPFRVKMPKPVAH